MSEQAQVSHATASSFQKPNYRPDIDGLRAVAVLAVLIFHAFPEKLKGGFVGVDVFFVISGYLISTIIIKNILHSSFTLTSFYGRRVRRIFPSLFLVCLATFTAGYFTLLPEELKQLGKHMMAGAGFISNLALWNESGYFDAAAETKPLLHLWSLGIEEQFYILWPILLFAVIRLKRQLFPIVTALTILSFFTNLYFLSRDPTATFYAPYTRFWELAAGGLLALHHITKRSGGSLSAAHLFNKNIGSLLGLLLIMAAAIGFTKDTHFPGWIALFPILGAVLIIDATPHNFINRYILSNKPMVWIGLISFPLYLWHWPLLYFAKTVETGLSPQTSLHSAIGLSFLLAGATYLFFEKPIRFGRKKKKKTLILCLAMLLIASLGAYSYMGKGLPRRFPPLLQGILSLNYDASRPYREGTCFLKENNDHIFTNCTSPKPTPHAKHILLWGDSHAAHLYPGIKKKYENTYQITQFTTGGCPPIWGYEIKERPNCIEINNEVMSFIKKKKPDRIFMTAVWINHKWDELEPTINRLKTLGIKEIVLVGPAPLWLGSLPKSLFKNYIQTPTKTLPTRLKKGPWDAIKPLDANMSAFAKKIEVRYLSPWSLLCNDEGCLTKVGETKDSITAWDYGHLTEKGSIYLVSFFPN